MTKEFVLLDPKSHQDFINKAADAIRAELILNKNIRLDFKQMKALAKASYEHIKVEIDYNKIQQLVLDALPIPQDGKDLLFTKAIRADVIETVRSLIPAPQDGKDGKPGAKGKDFKVLTVTQRADIAQETAGLVQDNILNELVTKALFVTKSRFDREMTRLRDLMVKRTERPINAGISGQDMIDEINKVLGVDWQGGGVSGGGQVFEVASEVAQLALTVEEGDIAVRSDEGKTYAALNNVNGSLAADWLELKALGAVSSVDGQTGAVDLSAVYKAIFSENTAFNKNFGSGAGQVAEGSAFQSLSEKGQANGYAELDGVGKVPASQLPPPGGGIGSVFVAVPDPNITLGLFRLFDLTLLAGERFIFNVPSDFVSLIKIVLIGLPTSGSAGPGQQINILSEYSTLAEPFNNHAESNIGSTFDLGIASQFFEIDLSSIFSVLAASDKASFFIAHTSVGGNIRYLGTLLEYSK